MGTCAALHPLVICICCLMSKGLNLARGSLPLGPGLCSLPSSKYHAKHR